MQACQRKFIISQNKEKHAHNKKGCPITGQPFSRFFETWPVKPTSLAA